MQDDVDVDPTYADRIKVSTRIYLNAYINWAKPSLS